MCCGSRRTRWPNLLKTVIQCEGTTSEIDPTFAMKGFLAELGESVAGLNTDRDEPVP
jgi:hypothetical protein